MPDQEPQEPVTMYSLYMKLGEINGTQKLFLESQQKINDQLFANDRASAAQMNSHNEFIEKYKPMMPTLENLDTGRKVTKWGLGTVILLGGANLLVPMWSYIKTIFDNPHIGAGP